jgi:hypothetical protein
MSMIITDHAKAHWSTQTLSEVEITSNDAINAQQIPWFSGLWIDGHAHGPPEQNVYMPSSHSKWLD